MLGIPDFRRPIDDDPSPNLMDPVVEELVQHFETSDYQELVQRQFAHSRLPEGLLNSFLQNELAFDQKGRDRLDRVRLALDRAGLAGALKGGCLDIGCGTGSSLIGLMRACEWGVGVDIALADLVLGKRYVLDHEIENVQFVCADAQRLPFADQTFDFINATDTIEHIVGGQERFLMEARRVLRPRGVFCFNSPNRFNLFAPEPHVKVYGVGFLPRPWMDRYVRLVKGVRYRNKHLLSYPELRRLLKRTFDGQFSIFGAIPNATVHRSGVKGLVARRTPWLIEWVNRRLKFFTTNYQVIAVRR